MNFLVIIFAKYVIYIVILLFVVYFILEKKLRRRLSFLTVITLPLALIVAKVLGHFISSPRPFVLEHIKPLIAHAPNNGFPSDHALLAMALATVTYLVHKRMGILLAMLAVLIGFSRVLAHVHHVGDILGAFVIAIVAGYVSDFLVKKFLTKK